jgi:hypothetical protein
METTFVTHMRRLWLPVLGAALLGGAGCGDMPEDDPGALEKVTLIALLEPGDSGAQEVRLMRPVDLGTAVNDTTSFLPGATLVLRRVSDGASIVLDEDAAGYRYVFDRADFPLAPGDSVALSVQGSWNGLAYSGEQGTRIVSPDGLEFTRKPNDRGHGLDADTLMVYDPAIEENFTNPTAFHVDFQQECSDGCSYQYQLEFLTVVKDSLTDEWVRTPSSRLHWLRDDEELAWQVGPYPDLRLPPGQRVQAQPVAWGFFVFVDEADGYASPTLDERRLGYYQITLRRLNGPAARFFFTTHWWIREQPTDPIEFNLQGEHCQGVVGSCARTSFRVAIVDDTPR